MNQKVKLSKAISYVIIVCAVLTFFAIWPVGFLHQTHVSKSNEIMAMESDPVSVENNVTQMFVGEGGELSAVDLYVCNDMRGETITFRLYDASYTEIFNTFHTVKDSQKFPGFVHIPVGFDLQKDQEYYFTVEGLSADMTVAYEARETSTSIVNGFMSYGGIEIQRFNVIIRYEYSNPFVWWQVVLLGIVIAAVTAGALRFVRYLFDQKLTDKEVKIQNVFQVTLNPVVLIGGLVLCLMIFPGKKFGTGMMNYAFYGSGVVLLTAVLLYIINYKRVGMDPVVEWQTVKIRIPEYLQAICFAKVLWSCYEYMNGLYDIHHSLAIRKLIIWFFLGIICTYSKKELLQKANVAFLFGAVIGAFFYAKPYFAMEEEGELYKLQACIIVTGCFTLFLFVRNIVQIIKKKEFLKRKWSVPYALCLALLLGLMIVFRNMRDWPVLTMVLFLVFYMRMWTWEKSNRMLKIFGNGLILNFIYMVGYCLQHRPYHRYYFYRYGLGFHTVTMTSVYLTLILCAIFARLYTKSRRKKRFKDMWFEWSILAIANVYLFLTLSRTGYLAAIVMEVFVVALIAMMQEKKKWITAGKYLGAILISSTLFFPIVFSMTRILPAIANDPILSEVEMTSHAITKGTPSDSKLYTDIGRVMKLAAYKVLGMYQDDFAFRDATPESLQEDYFYQALMEKVRSVINPGDIRIVNDNILLASSDTGIVEEGTLDNMTNGRVTIFRTYIDNWNLTGHEDMRVQAEDGEMIVHAHNIFLQVIHDHGLVTGVVFILFGVVSFILALYSFIKKQDEDMLLTVAVLLAFAVAGMAEWIFHLCNPFGFSVFVVITPLLFRHKDMRIHE